MFNTMGNIYKNKWFWVLSLAVLNLGLVGMTWRMVGQKVSQVEQTSQQASPSASSSLIPSPKPSPTIIPTMSPADARGQVLGESTNMPLPTAGSSEHSQNVQQPMLLVGSTKLNATAQQMPVLTEDEADVSARVVYILDSMSHRNANDVYGVMSSELTGVFTADDLQQMLDDVSITSYSLAGNLTITGDWAQQNVIVLSSGTSRTYIMVLHKEAGQWVFYGTLEKQ